MCQSSYVIISLGVRDGIFIDDDETKIKIQDSLGFLEFLISTRFLFSASFFLLFWILIGSILFSFDWKKILKTDSYFFKHNFISMSMTCRRRIKLIWIELKLLFRVSTFERIYFEHFSVIRDTKKERERVSHTYTIVQSLIQTEVMWSSREFNDSCFVILFFFGM